MARTKKKGSILLMTTFGEANPLIVRSNGKRLKFLPKDKPGPDDLTSEQLDQIVQASAVHMKEYVKSRAKSMGLTVSEYTNGFL